MVILFVKPKSLASGSLKYLKIPLVVHYKSVCYSARLRVKICGSLPHQVDQTNRKIAKDKNWRKTS